MKKKIILVMLLAMGYSVIVRSQTANVQPVGIKEKQLVARFLSYMHAERGPNYPEMMNCISPAYIKENTIDRSNYKVNNYTIWGFTIVDYSETESMVTTKVYGQKKAWTYELTFKVSTENGKQYIVPASFDTEWIHPWWTVDGNRQ
jgi:hypothetical protein